MEHTSHCPRGDSYLNPAFAWPEETSVALASRLRFVANQLRDIDARTVLDVGCGTGEQLTAWLAELCPDCQFHGIDSDEASIAYARSKFSTLANLTFATEMPRTGAYDAVIASEVLEHVANPCEFLASLRSQLRDGGLLIITTPNGYGCTEWMSLLETLLVVSGMWSVLQRIKRAVLGTPSDAHGRERDTHAVSPHVNFFSMRRLSRLYRAMRLEVVAYQGRMFLHHFLCTMLIDRSRSLAHLNAWLGARLPAWLVTDWMFALRATDAPVHRTTYRRNLYEEVKRYLNLKRFGLLS
ncbi:hypothetical protein AYO44_08800 [Planctomycetaceae bacterium SCGC AG-212-F19]|nr:hypothetical protein AYO44_08800 [Planctomycetaceae bacterium SCGC AG-212-F19]